jgi:hypothetical protein
MKSILVNDSILKQENNEKMLQDDPKFNNILNFPLVQPISC